MKSKFIRNSKTEIEYYQIEASSFVLSYFGGSVFRIDKSVSEITNVSMWRRNKIELCCCSIFVAVSEHQGQWIVQNDKERTGKTWLQIEVYICTLVPCSLV